jgi:hypothetical protein
MRAQRLSERNVLGAQLPAGGASGGYVGVDEKASAMRLRLFTETGGVRLKASVVHGRSAAGAVTLSRTVSESLASTHERRC